jgi:hypothetical protein
MKKDKRREWCRRKERWNKRVRNILGGEKKEERECRRKKDIKAYRKIQREEI